LKPLGLVGRIQNLHLTNDLRQLPIQTDLVSGEGVKAHDFWQRGVLSDLDGLINLRITFRNLPYFGAAKPNGSKTTLWRHFALNWLK